MAQNPNANDQCYASVRDEDKKVFVGGLGRFITEKELREYFTQYGEIENINLKIDPVSGLSRGFAFIQFVNAKTVDDLLAAGDHFIAKKKVDPRRAFKRVNPSHCKIFVSGITSEMTKQDVWNYFVQFGEIFDYHQPFDKYKNQKKGFCFITFKDPEVVNQVLKTSKNVINGLEIFVKKFKLYPETMTAIGARTGRAPATFGSRSVHPGYMASAAASLYGTAANYGYAVNAYNAHCPYRVYNYFGFGYGGSGGGRYSAQAYRGGQYREASNPRDASS